MYVGKRSVKVRHSLRLVLSSFLTFKIKKCIFLCNYKRKIDKLKKEIKFWYPLMQNVYSDVSQQKLLEALSNEFFQFLSMSNFKGNSQFS